MAYTRKWWHYPLAVIAAIVLSPLVVAVLVSYVVYSSLLHLLVWSLWCTRGIQILLVYSDSPKWHDYVEQTILPRMPTSTIVLNWSERRRWKRYSLSALVFRHFGGTREFNPLVLVFRPGRRTRTFRLWKAFIDFNQGKQESLAQLEAELLECVANL
jgi:hypothetical protein